MLAAVTATFPAAAEEQTPEPAKSRDAKTAEPTPPATVDLKIEGIRNGLQIRVLPKDEAPAPQPERGTSCKEDCQLKLPAGSYTLIATQIEAQETPGADLGAEPQPAMSDADASSRRRLGNTLGAGGVVAAVMGSCLVMTTLLARPNAHGEFLTGRTEFFYAGLAGIGVGAGLMIGGFSLAAANRATPMAVDRMPMVVGRRGLTEMGVSVTGNF